MFKRQLKLIITVVLILATLFLNTTEAEQIVLKNGGHLEGSILNPAGESEPESYRIQTRSGIEVEIAADQVDYVLYDGEAYQKYSLKIQNMVDSVDGNLAMANWCKLNKLSSLEKRHYRRVIELDPENKTARRELGYFQLDGVWTTRDEAMTAQGKVKYDGKWMLPQEKELLERKKSGKQASMQWRKQIVQWQSDLSGKKYQQAIDGLMSIKDPDAVPVLGMVLGNDKRAEARLVYIKVLGKLGTPEAMKILGQCAMNDPVEEVRLSCLDQLKLHQAQAAVDYFSTELKSKDNNRVNRAGALIGEIGDMNAVPALIGALTTKHKYTVGGGPGMSATQSNNGVSGMTMGNSTKTVVVTKSNAAVRSALQKITQQDFGYDKSAWTNWYSRNKQGGVESNLRRK